MSYQQLTICVHKFVALKSTYNIKGYERVGGGLQAEVVALDSYYETLQKLKNFCTFLINDRKHELWGE